MNGDFVRNVANGKEIRFTCQRVEDGWKVRLLRDGQKDYMAMETIDKAEDVYMRPNGGNVEMVIGLTALYLTPQTAEAFKAWLEENIEASKTDEEKAEEAEAAKREEIARIEGLLERAKVQQPRTPKTKKEAAELTRDLREFQAEEYGEWGSWPRIISEEEQAELSAKLAELKK